MQILSAIQETTWGRLFDIGISLGLLAVIAKVLWDKVKTLERKMDKYLDEDRTKMLDVIDKNTDALKEHSVSLKENNNSMQQLNDYLNRKG